MRRTSLTATRKYFMDIINVFRKCRGAVEHATTRPWGLLQLGYTSGFQVSPGSPVPGSPLHCSGCPRRNAAVPVMDSPGLYTTLSWSNVIWKSCSFPMAASRPRTQHTSDWRAPERVQRQQAHLPLWPRPSEWRHRRVRDEGGKWVLMFIVRET